MTTPEQKLKQLQEIVNDIKVLGKLPKDGTKRQSSKQRRKEVFARMLLQIDDLNEEIDRLYRELGSAQKANSAFLTLTHDPRLPVWVKDEIHKIMGTEPDDDTGE